MRTFAQRPEHPLRRAASRIDHWSQTHHPTNRFLTISSPGDSYEREADAVADKVMRMAEASPLGSGPVAIQRKCAECEDEESKMVQPKRSPSAHADAALDLEAAAHAAMHGGEPLS